MDQLLFQGQIEACRAKTEDVTGLEILNYSNSAISTAEKLSELRTTDAFMSFLKRETPFAPRELAEGVILRDGIRLILQTRAKDDEAFAPGVISLDIPSYKALIREFQLSFRCIDSSSAVGPCFWWAHVGDNLEFIFRKSDVEWKGTSRGWEMVLSYSFGTGITSGYVRGKGEKVTEKGKEQLKDHKTLKKVLDDLFLCGRPVSHPLLLPILTLCQELSSSNDKKQRDLRAELRKLDHALIGRYTVAPAAHYASPADQELDTLSHKIADCQTEVLQKRSQAWQNVVDHVKEATNHFWDHLPAEKKSPELTKLHKTLLERLNFLTVKLQGIENYAHVTLERLGILREVVHNIISQRESRLNLHIAIQQQRLAYSSGRDSASMKTLTLLGSFFLPGAFISSLFSMPFFDFSKDLDGHVSRSLWIYFVLSTPLTLAVFGFWQMFDKKAQKKHSLHSDDDDDEAKIWAKLEARIMRRIRVRTGIQVADTFPVGQATPERV
ncbi:hypothetical protein KVR01_012096 [Diaporthe batatas]|uniref:uncharacterized protein n=1 Tax=Diaporthe batatas TaxID=748121 RepID=UPI001D03A682|nr:uncharacterized protein KVR01_012096 [Diaporthe batatas]KAG8158335.1 hypothetical protein KVR01_012096 [Diaporthe batatas]